MISWISSWAANLVIAVIIATIIEMILPNSNNSKYVKTIIGIFILFTIISPVITKLTGEGISFSNIYDNLEYANIDKRKFAEINTSNNIEMVYINSLKEDLANKVRGKGYEAKEINMEVNMEENDDYGKINKISFRINKKKDNKDISIVNEIKININQEENVEKKQENISEEEYKQIKSYIAKCYEIDESSVNVY